MQTLVHYYAYGRSAALLSMLTHKVRCFFLTFQFAHRNANRENVTFLLVRQSGIRSNGCSMTCDVVMKNVLAAALDPTTLTA